MGFIEHIDDRPVCRLFPLPEIVAFDRILPLKQAPARRCKRTISRPAAIVRIWNLGSVSV